MIFIVASTQVSGHCFFLFLIILRTFFVLKVPILQNLSEYHIQDKPHDGMFGMHPFNAQATTVVKTVTSYYVFPSLGQFRESRMTGCIFFIV